MHCSWLWNSWNLCVCFFAAAFLFFCSFDFRSNWRKNHFFMSGGWSLHLPCWHEYIKVVHPFAKRFLRSGSFFGLRFLSLKSIWCLLFLCSPFSGSLFGMRVLFSPWTFYIRVPPQCYEIITFRFGIWLMELKCINNFWSDMNRIYLQPWTDGTVSTSFYYYLFSLIFLLFLRSI